MADTDKTKITVTYEVSADLGEVPGWVVKEFLLADGDFSIFELDAPAKVTTVEVDV